MLGPQGLPLAPAAATGGSGPLPIGNIAAMLSSFSGATSSPTASGSTGSPAPGSQDNALSNLLQHLEEAKKRLPVSTSSAATNAPAASTTPIVSTGTTTNTATPLRDPVAVLTGASANPLFTPTYGNSPSYASLPFTYTRESSWSPGPEPVIVQGPLGTSTLPSYEDMIVEGLRILGEAPPRTLFDWMSETYPLTKKFRPSAHQALQKAFKRGRLLKTGSMYRINKNWVEPGESRKPTRRPQVGRDHPMVTPGLNGEVLAVSPLKDSQAYRNVGDAGLRTLNKGMRLGPRPYGQPGAAPLANPASSIFQNGSAASIILEYQKRTGKKLDADSVKQLYQLIRAGPSDGSAEEMLAHLLTQTGYHDAAATATAAAAAQSAAAVSASMPSFSRPSTSVPALATAPSTPSAIQARANAAAAAQRRMPTTPIPKGPTSLPLPTTSEPTMMQQLASMLNDLSSPINPVLANSLLGQLSSNAAAAAAARAAANMPGMSSTAPPLPSAPARTLLPAPSATSSATSQLASALSSLANQTPQQDLDSAVSETLAAALQQIGGAPTVTAPATASEAIPTAAISDAAAVSKRAQVVDEGAASATVDASTDAEAVPAVEQGEGEGEGEAVEEGIDLAEYEDAIRALTSAFGNSATAEEEGDSEDESDVEADERAIAAAEAEPDSVLDEEGSATAGQPGQEEVGDTNAQAEEGMEDEDEEEEEEGEGVEEMDLSAVLRQLTASLQGQQADVAVDEGRDGGDEEAEEEETASPAEVAKDHAESAANAAEESMDVDPPAPASASAPVAEALAEEEQQPPTIAADEPSEPHPTQPTDNASLQAQLEALVASLAANAGNADDDEDEDDDDDEEEEEE